MRNNVAGFGLFLLNCLFPPFFLYLVWQKDHKFKAKHQWFFSILFFIAIAICTLLFPPAGFGLTALILTVWGFSSFASICGALIGYQMFHNIELWQAGLIQNKKDAQRLNFTSLAITIILIATTTALLIYFTPLSVPIVMALSIFATLITTLLVMTILRYSTDGMQFPYPTSGDSRPIYQTLLIKELASSLGYGHLKHFLPDWEPPRRLTDTGSRAESISPYDLASPRPALIVGIGAKEGLDDSVVKAEKDPLDGSFHVVRHFETRTPQGSDPRSPRGSLEARTPNQLLPILTNTDNDSEHVKTGFSQRKLLGVLCITILVCLILAIPPLATLATPAMFTTTAFQALMITAASLLFLFSLSLYKRITYQEELIHPKTLYIDSYEFRRISPTYKRVFYELVTKNDPELEEIRRLPDYRYMREDDSTIKIFDKTLPHFHIFGNTLNETFAQIYFDKQGVLSAAVFSKGKLLIAECHNNNRAAIKDFLKIHGFGTPKNMERLKAFGRYEVHLLTLKPNLGTQKQLANGSILQIPYQGAPTILKMSQAQDITKTLLDDDNSGRGRNRSANSQSQKSEISEYDGDPEASTRDLTSTQTPKNTRRRIDESPASSPERPRPKRFVKPDEIVAIADYFDEKHSNHSKKKTTTAPQRKEEKTTIPSQFDFGRARNPSKDKTPQSMLSPVKEGRESRVGSGPNSPEISRGISPNG